MRVGIKFALLFVIGMGIGHLIVNGFDPGPVEPVETPTYMEPELEEVTLFVIGEPVTITFLDGTIAEGTIIDVGPTSMWRNDETGEDIVSRVYMVSATVDGVLGFGTVPEFALSKRQ